MFDNEDLLFFCRSAPREKIFSKLFSDSEIDRFRKLARDRKGERGRERIRPRKRERGEGGREREVREEECRYCATFCKKLFRDISIYHLLVRGFAQWLSSWLA